MASRAMYSYILTIQLFFVYSRKSTILPNYLYPHIGPCDWLLVDTCLGKQGPKDFKWSNY